MLKSALFLVFGIVLFNLGQGMGGALGMLVQPAGLVLVVWAAWRLFKGFKGRPKAVPSGIPDHLNDLKFKHFHGKTGIAVDTDKREVHLKDRSNYKVYSFDQIRSWESSHHTGGGVYGGGMNGLAANLANIRANNERTGLFIKVKDVDFPEWKIEFPTGSAKKDLTRWMEILQQTLNEAVA